MGALELCSASVVRTGKAILNAASVAAQPCQFTVFCGPNGAGKSTGLSVLSGALKADQGYAALNGNKIQDIPANQLARQRAVVAQQSVLTFPFLVHEVVAMGRTPHEGRTTLAIDEQIIAHALNLLDLSHMADRNYLTLSGGERQRVQIARALAQLWPAGAPAQPQVTGQWLLLDEPTSALDLKYQIALMRLLKSLAQQGWGVVAVLHDLPLVVQHADHVVMFKDGSITAQGVPRDVLTPEVIQDTYDLDEPYLLAAG